MVVIRLTRGGMKKRPFYRIVAADKRRARDGKFIEQLGFFNPLARGQEAPIKINLERIEHWISQGAQPSLRVRDLIAEFKNPEAAAAKKQKKLDKVEAKAKAKADAEAKAAEEAAKAEAEAKAAEEKAAAEAAKATEAEAAPAEEKPAEEAAPAAEEKPAEDKPAE